MGLLWRRMRMLILEVGLACPIFLPPPPTLGGDPKTWESLNGGSQMGALRPLSAICAQSSTIVHFCGLFGPLSKGNFRHKMTTIVGNRGQLWASTLSPHLQSPHLDFPNLCFSVLSFLGLSRFFRDFPDLLGDGPGIFPIRPFALSRPMHSTYEEQSRAGPRHSLDLSRKKWETPRFGNPPV